MSRKAQMEGLEKETAKEEVVLLILSFIDTKYIDDSYFEIPKLEEEKAKLEQDWDEALEIAENTKDPEMAARQNKLADSIEEDMNDLKDEIEKTKKLAGSEQQSEDTNTEESTQQVSAKRMKTEDADQPE